MTLSIKSIGGTINEEPKIRNLRQEGKVDSDCFTLKYVAEDFENTILRHYIYLNGKRIEITKAVGYESANNEFTYTVKNLTIATKYKVQIEVTDGLDTVRSDVVTMSTSEIQIYGVRVDQSNSNPETCVKYIEQAVGLTPAKNGNLNSWKDRWPFNKVRLVGFKGGKVTKEINPMDKTKYVDGTTVPRDVDVMSEIPKIYWKVYESGNSYEIRIANSKVDSGYEALGHTVKDVEKDFIYVGAYLGYVQSGKMRSISGVRPKGDLSLNDAKNYSKNVGSGYLTHNWYVLKVLQICYLIAYKSLDSQTALGRGFTGGSGVTNTGGTNKKGLFYGSTNAKEQVCFMGIEDFFGNMEQWIAGIYLDNSYGLMATPDNYTFDRYSFECIGPQSQINDPGYMGYANATEKGLFFPSTGGSETTHYCDYIVVLENYFPVFGGYYASQYNAGAFAFQAHWRETDTNGIFGGRLVYI